MALPHDQVCACICNQQVWHRPAPARDEISFEEAMDNDIAQQYWKDLGGAADTVMLRSYPRVRMTGIVLPASTDTPEYKHNFLFPQNIILSLSVGNSRHVLFGFT